MCKTATDLVSIDVQPFINDTPDFATTSDVGPVYTEHHH